MKLNVPLDCGGLSVGDTEYAPDANGQIQVDDPTHVADLISLGASYPVAERPIPEEGSMPIPAPVHDQDLQTRHDALKTRVADLEEENSDLRSKLLDAGTDLAARDSEIATLKEGMKGTAEHGDAAASADTAAPAADASTGQTEDVAKEGEKADETAKEGEEGEKADETAKGEFPNFDEMSRDDMVVWLRGRGISVSPSISKTAARAAIDDALKAA